MTLHEAIEVVLKQSGRPMTAAEIAQLINQKRLYSREDGKLLPSSQVSARVKNYPRWFAKQGPHIALGNRAGQLEKSREKASNGRLIKNVDISHMENVDLVVKVLLQPKNFKSAGEIDGRVPDVAGMYAIRIREPKALPEVFANTLNSRNHNLIYIGIASKSLKRRMLGQELRAKGHGTFFRSLGAMLGYTPPAGSLIGKGNTRNYSFSTPDERKIISWINENLLINWVVLNEGWDELETQLILKEKPLMNIAKNPLALDELKRLRANCVDVANRN